MHIIILIFFSNYLYYVKLICMTLKFELSDNIEMYKGNENNIRFNSSMYAFITARIAVWQLFKIIHKIKLGIGELSTTKTTLKKKPNLSLHQVLIICILFWYNAFLRCSSAIFDLVLILNTYHFCDFMILVLILIR